MLLLPEPLRHAVVACSERLCLVHNKDHSRAFWQDRVHANYGQWHAVRVLLQSQAG